MNALCFLVSTCQGLSDNDTSGWKFWIPIFLAILLAIWNFIQQKSIQSLKSEIDKKLLVHKLQFETEFNTYRKTWKQLTSLQRKLQTLRPALDIAPQNDDYKRMIIERAEKIINDANDLVTLIEENRPFYPSLINQRLNDVSSAIREEIFKAGHVTDNLDYWISKESRFEKIHNAVNLACKAIRDRVGTD